jgi:predicted secreted protein
MTAAAVMRPPLLGSVAGGVGATVLAALLQCEETGVVAADGSQPVDVLVCRSTARSVRDAIAIASRMRPAPVLAVVADCPQNAPSAVRHRLHMAGPNLPAIVRVPWWGWLRDVDDPPADTATLAWGEVATTKAGKSVQSVRAELVNGVTPLLRRPLPRPVAGDSDSDNPPVSTQAYGS